MKYKLICNEEHKELVTELIESYGFKKSFDYDILFVDNFLGKKYNEVYINFSCDELESLKRYLSKVIFPTTNIDKIIVKDCDSYIPLDYKQVEYISAGNNCCIVHAEKEFKVNLSLQELEIRLNTKGFIRINKSEIINLSYITKMDPWFSSRLILKTQNNNELTVTKSYYKSFKKFIGF